MIRLLSTLLLCLHVASAQWVNIHKEHYEKWSILEKEHTVYIKSKYLVPKYKVLVLFTKASSAYDIAINTMLEVFHEKELNLEVELHFTNAKSLQASLNYARRKKVNLIYAMGSKSVNLVYNSFLGEEIPVVSVCAKDPVLLNQSIDYDQGSGNNFAFTSLGIPALTQMQYLKLMFPKLKNLVFLYSFHNSSAIKTQVIPLQRLAKKEGIKSFHLGLKNKTKTKEELISKIKKMRKTLLKQDPSLQHSLFLITGSTSVFRELKSISEHAKGIAIFSMVPDLVHEKNYSALLSIGISFASNAHVAALYGYKILEKKSPAQNLPVGLVFPPDISLNLQKAQELQIKVPFELFEIANTIYDAKGIKHTKGKK